MDQLVLIKHLFDIQLVQEFYRVVMEGTGLIGVGQLTLIARQALLQTGRPLGLQFNVLVLFLNYGHQLIY